MDSYWAADNQLATPPWCEHEPVWFCDFEYVPSLHFAVEPAGSALVAAIVGIELEAAAAGAVFAAVVAAGDDFDIVPDGCGVAAGAATAGALATGAAAAGAVAVDFVAGVF